jgi:uncharacterized protein YjbI with pentapeptide repeats
MPEDPISPVRETGVTAEPSTPAAPMGKVDSPPASDSTIAFAAKARDLAALRDSVVDAAGVGAGLWFSYLFVLLYLAIATGSVTHRDLLYENPVKLPFLNVDLPMIGFFVLAPLLFVIVHTYVLLHIGFLGRKVGAFHAELRAQIAEDDTRARLRLQLPSNIFVQFLAGPSEVRTGITGVLVRAIAWISLIIGPATLLIFFVLQFLPYHHESVLWWQRLLVTADLALLWGVWPQIAYGASQSSPRAITAGRLVAAGASAVALVLVFGVATFPGEWLDTHLPEARLIPTKLPVMPHPPGTPPPPSYRWWSLHELLVVGSVDLVARAPGSLFSNRLVVPGLDVVDHAKFDTEAKIDALPYTVSLRGRRLEGAVLIGAVLRKADLTAAKLAGGNFVGADLRQAKFECSPRTMGESRSQDCADLRGAVLDFAQMQGALLSSAQLEGASLKFAQLQGALLDEAQLQGVDLGFSRIEGASLILAQLQGALFNHTQLQGARLDLAGLQGATLDYVQMQGASLNQVQLQGAQLQSPYVWRADPRTAANVGAKVVAPVTSRVFLGKCGNPPADFEDCEWSTDTFQALKGLISGAVRGDDLGKAVRDRIATLNPDMPVAEEADMARAWADAAQAWKNLSTSPAGDATFHNHRWDALQWAYCKSGSASWVIHSIVSRSPEDAVDRVRSMGAEGPKLLDTVLHEDKCPGARGLSGEDRTVLTMLRNVFSPTGVGQRNP